MPPSSRRAGPRAKIAEPGAPTRLPKALYELLGFQLRMAHAVLYRQFVVSLEDLDLTPRQYAVLQIIADGPGISQIDIAGLLAMDRPTTMAIVNRLQDRGLIERRASSSDRRRQELHLTPDGADFVERAEVRVAEHEARMTQRYTAEELATLMALVRRLHEEPLNRTDPATPAD